MDITCWTKFKKDINILNSYIQNIDSTEVFEGINNKFEELKINLNKLSNFVNSNDNIFVTYINKAKRKDNSYPFDIICNVILDKFKEFSPYLISNSFHELNMKDKEHFLDILNETLKNRKSTFRNFFEKLSTLINIKIINAFEILNKLSAYNKTLIILGANGSGKTSFANFLRNADSHIKVIPASKPIKLKGYIPNIYNSTIDQSSNEIFSKNDLNEDLLQKLIIGICTEHDNITRIYYDTGEKDISIFVKIKKIFEDFFDIELDNSEFSNKKIMARKKGERNKFEFNNMSDGERVAFFYIATTMLAPLKSFIVVDEPENHLNPAIYNKLWDRLIKERGDCQFVFISHTMEFINARTDFELVKIKKFSYPDKFKFEFFGDSLENIDQDFLIEMIGSRKPILFCEGIKSSYDYKIYEVLFGDKYTVIPAGNCSSVINSVEACNKHATRYSIQKAIGIIDSDLKIQEEIEKLQNKNIYTLKCNEIEMILIDENIFKKVMLHNFIEGNDVEEEFNSFKEKFFNKLIERKDFIIKRYVKTKVDDELHKSIIDDKSNKSKEELKENLEKIVNNIQIYKLWDIFDKKLTEIITNKDFDAALRYCCLEHSEILSGICNHWTKNYATLALGVLKNDISLLNIIKEKYFGCYHL